jgi:hypothetical protein
MAVFNKFNSFTSELGKGTHNFSAHVLKAAFSNTAPVATNSVLADITQIAASGGYVAGGVTLDAITWTTASGVAKLTIADEVFTATGSVGPFRYVVIYNDTPTSPADPLIGWYDYGSSITLNTNETLTIDFDATNGVLTVS